MLIEYYEYYVLLNYNNCIFWYDEKSRKDMFFQ